jgi:hypothetical protein
VRDIRITHEIFAIHPVTNQIFQRAGETFPTVVGTLDAIHLATARSIREIEIFDLLLTTILNSPPPPEVLGSR